MGYRSAISIGAALAILVLAAVPEQVWTQLPVLCVFRAAFDIECLGCGMTRALAAVAHGDLQRGLSINAGVAAVAPLLALAALQGLRFPR